MLLEVAFQLPHVQFADLVPVQAGNLLVFFCSGVFGVGVVKTTPL